MKKNYTVSMSAIRDYNNICHASFKKARTQEEVEYKIVRSIELGKLFQTTYNRKNNYKIFAYFNLMIYVDEYNKVFKIKKHRSKLCAVNEKTKKDYNLTHDTTKENYT